MRPSRSRRSRRTHRNRRGGAGDKPLFTFAAAQPNPNLPMNPLNPAPYVHMNPPVNPGYVNPNPPPAPQLQKTHKEFPHPFKLGGKRRRTRRSRR
jgi:hypothetical protein